MDENQQVTTEKKEVHSSKEHHKHTNKKTFGDKLKDIRGEFNKIIWPSKKDLAKQTATVIVTSAILGGIIVSLDAIFAFGMGAFSVLVNK